jgi:hypothetical protein
VAASRRGELAAHRGILGLDTKRRIKERARRLHRSFLVLPPTCRNLDVSHNSPSERFLGVKPLKWVSTGNERNRALGGESREPNSGADTWVSTRKPPIILRAEAQSLELNEHSRVPPCVPSGRPRRFLNSESKFQIPPICPNPSTAFSAHFEHGRAPIAAWYAGGAEGSRTCLFRP